MPLAITLPLATLQSNAVAQINTAASDKILGKYPQWMQSNMLAQWNGLVLADALLGAGVLTNQNGADGMALRAAWAWIESVRDASNTASAAVGAATDYPTLLAAVASYNTTLAGL